MNQSTDDEEEQESLYRAESLRRWSMQQVAMQNQCQCVGQFICKLCKGKTMLSETPQGLLQPYIDRLKQLGLKDPGLWVMCCNSHEWILFNSKALNGGNKSFATWDKVEEYVKSIVAQTTDTES